MQSKCWSSGGSGQYEGCGEILFNNTVPSGAKLRELIGYGTFFVRAFARLFLRVCGRESILWLDSEILFFFSGLSSILMIQQLFFLSVQQFDFHLPSLTVKETLLFHANLRLPQDTDPLKRLQRVQQVKFYIASVDRTE